MSTFFLSPLFWGGALLLFGVSLVLRAFGVEFPVIRLAFGLILVALGVRVLLGWGAKKEDVGNRAAETLFGQQTATWTPGQNRWRTVFGQTDLDLSAAAEAAPGTVVTVESIFGSTVIRLPKNAPVRIEGETAFGETALPDGTAWSGFGKGVWEGGPAAARRVTLRTKAIFGDLRFRADP